MENVHFEVWSGWAKLLVVNLAISQELSSGLSLTKASCDWAQKNLSLSSSLQSSFVNFNWWTMSCNKLVQLFWSYFCSSEQRGVLSDLCRPLRALVNPKWRASYRTHTTSLIVSYPPTLAPSQTSCAYVYTHTHTGYTKTISNFRSDGRLLQPLHNWLQRGPHGSSSRCSRGPAVRTGKEEIFWSRPESPPYNNTQYTFHLSKAVTFKCHWLIAFKLTETSLYTHISCFIWSGRLDCWNLVSVPNPIA